MQQELLIKVQNACESGLCVGYGKQFLARTFGYEAKNFKRLFKTENPS